jgi:hypothetical protein
MQITVTVPGERAAALIVANGDASRAARSPEVVKGLRWT